MGLIVSIMIFGKTIAERRDKMKAYLISDNVDTQVGMRLAGIKGIVVHERDEVFRRT